MRIFKLTKLGERAVRHENGKASEPEDFRILEFIGDRGDASMSDIEPVGEQWRVEGLKNQGLVEELTS